MNTSRDKLVADLHAETALIAWHELQRFFAQGRVMWVAAERDLVAIASFFAADDAAEVESLLNKQWVKAVTDEQARAWYEADAQLWSVVVAPFVLVQERAATSD